ncbi:hypothetical protein CVD28_01450 [Bacillus sp. M6-12]|uniref:hypothetical protein n=1 Tax=Bacillus sp. M6-12 TaxID=2054166 RepID=UPI000C78B693|nr:hypothetical protein [Bacillus sp. M6-12]PLS19100.1 hypothetical protein CVD28_01450 [Bacillus sp. M6-12]
MNELMNELGKELQIEKLEHESEYSYCEKVKAYAKEHPEEAERAIIKVSKRKPFYHMSDKEKEETKDTLLQILTKVAFGVLRV